VGRANLFRYGDFIIVKASTDVKEPEKIQLTNMNLVIKQYVDGVSKVVVDISPGIHNQGGDSEPLTMVVKANVDPYTVYTESDELGIIEGSARVRGDVRFILPKNSEYTFSVDIEEKGSTIVSGDVDEIIKLNEIYFNTPMTFKIIEEGMPPVPTPEPEPGFSGIVALLGLLIMFSIMVRTQNKR
jgi:hypothetical protein